MLFGAGEALTNDQVLRADNAAVALRLLGQRAELVWYVPTYEDLTGGRRGRPRTLLPRWIEPGLWLLLVACRVPGRSGGPGSLGRLATEPLPVVVKAIETTRSRGRLYRRAGDRGHAAAALRSAARRRAAVRLRLGAGHSEADLVRDVARHTGRPEAEVAALVGSAGPAPHSRPRPDPPGRRPGRARQRGTQPMSTPGMTEPPHDARERLVAVRTEVAKAVVGQDAAVSGLLVALLCGGHVLMEGVPGTAKTLLVRTLSASLSVGTRRVQFTPDLMPGDITGSMVIDSRQGELSFREGPVFTNLLLADEINRTPPKTQSALLEAMEEGQVSVDGVTHPLPRPFLVAATQNPVEYEGTYPLPEAQLDRFLLKVVLPIPDAGRRAGDPHAARRRVRPARRRRCRGQRGGLRRTTSRPARPP